MIFGLALVLLAVALLVALVVLAVARPWMALAAFAAVVLAALVLAAFTLFAVTSRPVPSPAVEVGPAGVTVVAPGAGRAMPLAEAPVPPELPPWPLTDAIAVPPGTPGDEGLIVAQTAPPGWDSAARELLLKLCVRRDGDAVTGPEDLSDDEVLGAARTSAASSLTEYFARLVAAERAARLADVQGLLRRLPEDQWHRVVERVVAQATSRVHSRDRDSYDVELAIPRAELHQALVRALVSTREERGRATGPSALAILALVVLVYLVLKVSTRRARAGRT